MQAFQSNLIDVIGCCHDILEHGKLHGNFEEETAGAAVALGDNAFHRGDEHIGQKRFRFFRCQVTHLILLHGHSHGFFGFFRFQPNETLVKQIRLHIRDLLIEQFISGKGGAANL